MTFNSRTIDDLKAEGLFFTAGALTFQKGYGRSYGPHFGLRSTIEADRAEFFAGYDAASLAAKR
jgi:hypothetical protein